tara:strand:- start:430 stop:681 length:252 start_codon:yes stop_codon:yes gene_type:complete
MTFQIPVNGHWIELWLSVWNGKERVHYDGQLVSEKRSFMFETVHSFQALEDGQRAIYEVVATTGLTGYGYAVRRNGIIQSHSP